MEIRVVKILEIFRETRENSSRVRWNLKLLHAALATLRGKHWIIFGEIGDRDGEDQEHNVREITRECS